MGRDSDQDDAGLTGGEEPGTAGGDEEFLADPEREDEQPSPEAELLNDVTQHYLGIEQDERDEIYLNLEL